MAAVIRAQQRDMWASAAADWRGFPESTEPLNRRLVLRSAAKAGDRVLDLACGTGMPALALAQIVGPEGYVLGLDLVSEMIEIARQEATARNLHNVEFRVIESETDLDVAPESFHAATCKHGFMWMPDPLAACHSLLALLKPGGRLAASTWMDTSKHPLLSIVPTIARRHFLLPVDWPSQPPSPLLSEDALVQLLGEAGFYRVETEHVPLLTDTFESPAAYVNDAILDDPALEASYMAVPLALRAQARAEMIQRVTEVSGQGPLQAQVDAVVVVGVKN
jgi:SAM-dependent methyltransferase